jgi:hypothetical protein
MEIIAGYVEALHFGVADPRLRGGKLLMPFS